MNLLIDTLLSSTWVLGTAIGCFILLLLFGKVKSLWNFIGVLLVSLLLGIIVGPMLEEMIQKGISERQRRVVQSLSREQYVPFSPVYGLTTERDRNGKLDTIPDWNNFRFRIEWDSATATIENLEYAHESGLEVDRIIAWVGVGEYKIPCNLQRIGPKEYTVIPYRAWYDADAPSEADSLDFKPWFEDQIKRVTFKDVHYLYHLWRKYRYRDELPNLPFPTWDEEVELVKKEWIVTVQVIFKDQFLEEHFEGTAFDPEMDRKYVGPRGEKLQRNLLD